MKNMNDLLNNRIRDIKNIKRLIKEQKEQIENTNKDVFEINKSLSFGKLCVLKDNIPFGKHEALPSKLTIKQMFDLGFEVVLDTRNKIKKVYSNKFNIEEDIFSEIEDIRTIRSLLIEIIYGGTPLDIFSTDGYSWDYDIDTIETYKVRTMLISMPNGTVVSIKDIR